MTERERRDEYAPNAGQERQEEEVSFLIRLVQAGSERAKLVLALLAVVAVTLAGAALWPANPGGEEAIRTADRPTAGEPWDGPGNKSELGGALTRKAPELTGGTPAVGPEEATRAGETAREQEDERRGALAAIGELVGGSLPDVDVADAVLAGIGGDKLSQAFSKEPEKDVREDSKEKEESPREDDGREDPEEEVLTAVSGAGLVDFVLGNELPEQADRDLTRAPGAEQSDPDESLAYAADRPAEGSEPAVPGDGVAEPDSEGPQPIGHGDAPEDVEEDQPETGSPTGADSNYPNGTASGPAGGYEESLELPEKEPAGPVEDPQDGEPGYVPASSPSDEGGSVPVQDPGSSGYQTDDESPEGPPAYSEAPVDEEPPTVTPASEEESEAPEEEDVEELEEDIGASKTTEAEVEEFLETGDDDGLYAAVDNDVEQKTTYEDSFQENENPGEKEDEADEGETGESPEVAEAPEETDHGNDKPNAEKPEHDRKEEQVEEIEQGSGNPGGNEVRNDGDAADDEHDGGGTAAEKETDKTHAPNESGGVSAGGPEPQDGEVAATEAGSEREATRTDSGSGSGSRGRESDAGERKSPGEGGVGPADDRAAGPRMATASAAPASNGRPNESAEQDAASQPATEASAKEASAQEAPEAVGTRDGGPSGESGAGSGGVPATGGADSPQNDGPPDEQRSPRPTDRPQSAFDRDGPARGETEGASRAQRTAKADRAGNRQKKSAETGPAQNRDRLPAGGNDVGDTDGGSGKSEHRPQLQPAKEPQKKDDPGDERSEPKTGAGPEPTPTGGRNGGGGRPQTANVASTATGQQTQATEVSVGGQSGLDEPVFAVSSENGESTVRKYTPDGSTQVVKRGNLGFGEAIDAAVNAGADPNKPATEQQISAVARGPRGGWNPAPQPVAPQGQGGPAFAGEADPGNPVADATPAPAPEPVDATESLPDPQVPPVDDTAATTDDTYDPSTVAAQSSVPAATEQPAIEPVAATQSLRQQRRAQRAYERRLALQDAYTAPTTDSYVEPAVTEPATPEVYEEPAVETYTAPANAANTAGVGEIVDAGVADEAAGQTYYDQTYDATGVAGETVDPAGVAAAALEDQQVYQEPATETYVKPEVATYAEPAVPEPAAQEVYTEPVADAYTEPVTETYEAPAAAEPATVTHAGDGSGAAQGMVDDIFGTAATGVSDAGDVGR